MMPSGQHGQFYGQWPQQPFMADQIPNNHGYANDRQHYASRGGYMETDSMNGPRFVNPMIPLHQASRSDMSQGSSFNKSKKGSTKPKAVTTRPKHNTDFDSLLNSETIDAIRTIKEEVSYLERELGFTFKNFKKIVPFYNLPKPPKEIELSTSKTTRPPTSSDQVSLSKKEPKKVNKYIQNFFEKYENEEPVSQGIKSNTFVPHQQAEFNSTIPKPTKPPEPKTNNKAQKTSQDLYKRSSPLHNDSMSFDGSSRPRDQYQTLTLDQEGINFDSNIQSLRNSQMSRASTGSKRRESFENFKKQYFQDTSIRPNLVPQPPISKKFTR